MSLKKEIRKILVKHCDNRLANDMIELEFFDLMVHYFADLEEKIRDYYDDNDSERREGLANELLDLFNVVGRSEQFKCAMQLSKSGKRCNKQCIDCELGYKNYSI